MKKLLITIAIIITSFTGFSQDSKTGIWEGKLDVGVILRIVFHVNHADDTYTVLMDSPDQEAYGFKADSVRIQNDSIYVSLKKLRISYAGFFKNDTTLEGNFIQVRQIPLMLKKVKEISKIRRPQTPEAPFPYEKEDVVFFSTNTNLKYGATITYPSIPPGTNYIKAPTYPVAILISGSGAQDRNEAIMKHQPFALIADALTKKGFLVIRTDDRGVGKSTGDFSKANSKDFTNDIMAVTDYIKKYVHADSFHLFLIGHSEGGMIAPMVANKRKDIYGIVSLAGISIPASELMLGQGVAILKSTGVKDSALHAYEKLYKKLLASMRKTNDSVTAYASGIKILNKWKKTQPTTILKDLDISTEKNQQFFIKTLANTFTTPWFHYFLNYDPRSQIKKLKNLHVLVLNGDEDIQVLKKKNLEAFERYLKKSKVKSYTVKSYPNLNHLFQHCTTCTIAEYGILEETFSPEVLKDMSGWMLKVL